MKIDSPKLQVLVCTKEDALQKDISSLLGGAGLKVLDTFDRQEMFRLLGQYQPAVLILDAELPRILGFEVYEMIKRFDRFKDIKVITISSTARSLLGVDECIEREKIKDLLLSKVMAFIKEDMESVSSSSQMDIHEEARRLAKIIVSDIVLYNRDKAERGVRDGTFYELLKKEIEEGRRFYCNRVSPTILTTTNYYDEAIEDFIRKSSQI